MGHRTGDGLGNVDAMTCLLIARTCRRALEAAQYSVTPRCLIQYQPVMLQGQEQLNQRSRVLQGTDPRVMALDTQCMGMD